MFLVQDSTSVLRAQIRQLSARGLITFSATLSTNHPLTTTCLLFISTSMFCVTFTFTRLTGTDTRQTSFSRAFCFYRFRDRKTHFGTRICSRAHIVTLHDDAWLITIPFVTPRRSSATVAAIQGELKSFEGIPWISF